MMSKQEAYLVSMRELFETVVFGDAASARTALKCPMCGQERTDELGSTIDHDEDCVVWGYCDLHDEVISDLRAMEEKT